MTKKQFKRSPAYKTLKYKLSHAGHYELIEPGKRFKDMPALFVKETVWRPETIDAPYCVAEIRGGERIEPMLSGLREITEGLYYGDLLNKKDYLIFSFSPNRKFIDILYHVSFFPHKPAYRDKLNSRYIAVHKKRWDL